jgi:hypothetical protein
MMPCSLVDYCQCFGGICCLHFRVLSTPKMEAAGSSETLVMICESTGYSSTMNLEVEGFSEMLVIIYQNTRHHILKERSLHSHCEYLKSCRSIQYFG